MKLIRIEGKGTIKVYDMEDSSDDDMGQKKM